MSLKNAMGVSESVVFAPEVSNKKYAYRTGMGMMNSAEWNVVFDDFNSVLATNVPDGWAGAVIDTGATVIQSTTATAANPGTGVISIVSSTASEGAAIYMPKAVMLKTGKRFIMEARIYTDDVTDNDFQFGLSDLTATSNPEDLWTTTAANVVSFGLLDGSAFLKCLVDENNGGTSAQTSATSMTASTWTTLAIEWTGSRINFYKDGELLTDIFEATTANQPIDDTLLAPFVGARNGNGAGGNTQFVDYVRIIQER